MRLHLGRHVFGLAAIAFGVIAFVWRDFNSPWQQIRALGIVPHREILVYIAALEAYQFSVRRQRGSGL